jgi:hypothetical protein
MQLRRDATSKQYLVKFVTIRNLLLNDQQWYITLSPWQRSEIQRTPISALACSKNVLDSGFVNISANCIAWDIFSFEVSPVVPLSEEHELHVDALCPSDDPSSVVLD